LAAPLAEKRKTSIDAVDRVALVGARDRVAAEHEVLVHGHLREQAARLREVADAQADDLVRPASRDISTVERDAPRGGHEIAERRLEKRRLAGAIGTDDADDRAVGHPECRRLDDLELAVAGTDALKLEHRYSRAQPVRAGPRSRAGRRESP